MRYILAYTGDGFICCARCGKTCNLTKDHYIPRCYGRDINYDYILVPLCGDCNLAKDYYIVEPEWYKQLDGSAIKRLYGYLGRVRGRLGSGSALAEKIDKILKTGGK